MVHISPDILKFCYTDGPGRFQGASGDFVKKLCFLYPFPFTEKLSLTEKTNFKGEKTIKELLCRLEGKQILKEPPHEDKLPRNRKYMSAFGSDFSAI